MKTLRILCAYALTCFCTQVQTLALSFQGVEFPGGIASFADAVVRYVPGPSSGGADAVAAPFNDPTAALGAPDYPLGKHELGFVSLGEPGGELVVRFLDNSLVASGDSSVDLWIFEAGSVPLGSVSEPTDVFISTDGEDWISVGTALGSTSGIDIDAWAGVLPGRRYAYVRIVEIDPPGARDTGYPFAGADIDAVGAVSSATPVPDGGISFTLLAMLGALLVADPLRRGGRS